MDNCSIYDGIVYLPGGDYRASSASHGAAGNIVRDNIDEWITEYVGQVSGSIGGNPDVLGVVFSFHRNALLDRSAANDVSPMSAMWRASLSAFIARKIAANAVDEGASPEQAIELMCDYVFDLMARETR